MRSRAHMSDLKSWRRRPHHSVPRNLSNYSASKTCSEHAEQIMRCRTADDSPAWRRHRRSQVHRVTKRERHPACGRRQPHDHWCMPGPCDRTRCDSESFKAPLRRCSKFGRRDMTPCELTTSPCAVYNDPKVFALRTVNARRHAGDHGEHRPRCGAFQRLERALDHERAVKSGFRNVTCWLSRRA